MKTILGLRRLPATRVPLNDGPEEVEPQDEDGAAAASFNTFLFVFFVFLQMGFAGLSSHGERFRTVGFEGLGLASTVVGVAAFSWSTVSA